MNADGRGHADLLRKAFLAIEDLEAKLAALERARKEPIAIVGMACRFPAGADDPEAFWRLLRDGSDAITEVPPSRWDVDALYDRDPNVPGKIYTRHGGFLDGADLFDAEFFGIAPREAAGMDPQQRLLLEVSWEALEDAGLPLERLVGSQTGVFVGIGSNDYGSLGIRTAHDGAAVDAYSGTGNTFSVAAGRVAYVLGLQGPALAVDTACSSSLVTVDLACQSLRSGRCDLAFAGGVNLLLFPLATLYLCKARALSPDGRCRTFDAAASGYVRGEGCGMVVLKRLADAVRDGDRLLAVVRGSAVNHDGRSGGLTVPSGRAQQAVLRAALADAGVQPAEVSFVEAHGTGTPLGDPIEVRALAQVFGPGRAPDQRLAIGSVKTNVGHLEAAAGIVSLIKVVLALQHGEIPPHLHLRNPNPHVPWADLPVVVPTRPTPWQPASGRRVAGVSAFGLAGTNAHVILEEAPTPARTPAGDRAAHLLALSAKGDRALRELAGRFASHLAAHPEESLADVAHTANGGRGHFDHRLALVSACVEEVGRHLAAVAAGEPAPGVWRGVLETSEPPDVAFLFPGEGSQYVGMGRELYATEPAFRQALDRCDALLGPLLPRPLLEVLYPPAGEASPLHETAYAEPALFAVGYAVAQLWRSWGVEPAWVLGHGVGEYVAACVAGVFGLEDGLRLVAERGRLMGRLPGDGASPQVEPILEEFEAVAAGVVHAAPRLGWVSTLTGAPVAAGEAGAGYWTRQARQPVQFAEAVRSVRGRGCRLFVEAGPGGVLAGLVARLLPGGERWLVSLRPGRDEGRQLLESLAELYAAGGRVDWAGLDRGRPHRRLALPTYPFQRRRFWLEWYPNGQAPTASSSPSTAVVEGPGNHGPTGSVDGESAGTPRDEQAPADAEFLRQVRETPPGRRHELLVAHLQTQIAQVLRLEEPPPPRRGFFDMGMDSLMAVELRGRLEARLGKSLPATLAFDHPTVERLAGYLLGEVLGFDPTDKGAAGATRRRALDEPIAVVGLGCRFPGGANDPEAFWRLLRDGKDAVREVPRERWDVDAVYDPDPDAQGKTYVRQAAFLDCPVDQFDAEFFGITPREAVSMDPQQRLLLEICWEALENAGQSPAGLEGSRTGIFVGINSNDYGRLPWAAEVRSGLDAYAFTGNTSSVAAGRLSFILGLQGPCLAVDTSCSSSLVAVHLACQSLRAGECSLALAGGVNLMLAPEANVVLSRMRALAPDGRCKSFDAAADGYGRGEGAGVVVLKRLSDALAAGDDIRAVVLASAVNHDGPASGLTVPNGPAQQALIREALAAAGVEPARVGYLEAHGTGTPLGDPIEMEAASKVLCDGRTREQPLVVGSVKTNVGHLEAAAGAASLLKVVLSLQHGEIPAHLHFQTPSPYISWEGMPVVIPTAALPWPAADGPRLAGVSSFGMSGTNAHVLIQEAPATTLPAPSQDRPWRLVPLSARSETALRELAQRYAEYLGSEAAASLTEVAFTAATGRSHFNHRVAVVAASPRHLHELLTSFVAGQPAEGLVQGKAPDSNPPEVAFLFPGHGSQYVGMGRELYATEPAFRQALDRCDALLGPLLPRPLLEVLYPPAGEASPLHETAYADPALFAVEYAVAQLWRSWGVEPAWVVGHGVGEYVAACVAGVFGLEDSLRLVAERGRLMGRLSSPRVEPILGEFEAVAAGVVHAAPRLGWISTLTGAPVAPGEAGAGYWARQARQPVQFAEAVRSVLGRGCRLFVEAGPGGVLAGLGARLLSGDERWLVSLRPGRDEGRQLLESLAELYAAGGRVDWAGLDRGRPHRRLALPTYPFQRRRFWWQLPSATSGGPAAGPPGDEWLYELQWQHAERSDPTAGEADQPGRWVIFADGDSLASRLAQLLEARGQTCMTVRAGSSYQELGEGRFTVDPAQPANWERLVSRILTSAEPPCRGLVHCWSLNTPPPEQTTQPVLEAVQAMTCGSLLHLVQALIKTGTTSLPRLWLVTRGGQPVAPGEDGLAPAQSLVWGLGRVVRFEHPEAWRGAIDLDPAGPAEEAGDLFQEIWNPDGQDELAFRDGRRFVARLIRSPARGRPAPASPVRPDRTYLITGGLGSLGRKIAGWMIDHGAKHLVLTGRSAPSASAREDLAAWDRQGARVVVARADVAQREQLAVVLEDTGRSQPPLAGVIHAAGVLDDGVLLMQDWARFAKVMAPKVAGAWNVHSLTEGMELDFFVLFSSMASMLGSPGQGNYAAANSFLDVLAHYRRARGLPAVSINWGAWAEVGMAAELARRSPVQQTPEGVTAMPLDRGLAVLGRLLTGAPPQVGVLPVDWKVFLNQFPDGAELPVLADVAREAGPREPSAASQPESELLKRLAAVPAGERLGLVVDHIRTAVATIMGLDVAQAPEPQQGFFDMGLDSLMAIELKNNLVASLGRSLSATVVFQHPTILDLAGYVLSDVLPAAGPEPTNGAAAPPPGAAGLDDLSEDELLALLAQEVGNLERRVSV